MKFLSWRDIAPIMALATACFISGFVGLAVAYGETLSTAVWPPAGIALAAMLRYGYRIWPGAVVGTAALALMVEMPAPALLAVTLSSALSPLLGTWLLRRWPGFDSRLPGIADIIALLVLGGAVPACLNVTVSMLGFLVSPLSGPIEGWHWLIWWLGDTAGVLLLTPPLLLASSTNRPPAGRSTEGLFALLLLAIVCTVSFGSWPPDNESLVPLAFLPVPVLIWIAIRLPLHWTTLAILLVAGAAILGTALGHGPFVRRSATGSLALLWSFVTIYGLLSLLLGAGVSTQRRMLESLQQQRNFVSTILDTADALIIVLDRDWRIVRFNRACETVSGRQAHEVLGRPFWDLDLVPDDERQATYGIASGVRQGKLHDYWENHWRARDGSLHLISWSSNVLQGEDGRIEYLVGIGVDITERRRAEEEARRWQTQLAHLDRVATAAEMASGLAHELNQPLMAISSYCEVARSLADDQDGELMQVIDCAAHQAHRAGAIIRHMRGFVGKPRDDSRWVDLNAVIGETLGFLESEIRRKGVSIHLALEEPLPPLWLDAVQIEQVLVNLLRNACEAMLDARSPQREITLASRLCVGHHIEIRVQDSGPGIAPQLYERIFEPFESTKPSGLGMGLTISRSIVEARGGRLWADSGAGPGACFRFTLPLAQHEHRATAPPCP